MIKNLFLYFIQTLARLFSYIPVLVYGYLYSQYFTKATYKKIAQRNHPPASKVLDIGTATGHPLKSIISSFSGAEVVGIDIDQNYIPACQKLFKNNQNVTIKLMNFYELSQGFPDVKFDTIIFGSSFMLMPDQSKAIEIARKHLQAKGKIYFLLTLYDNKNQFNKFMEKVKPYLKYITTVDFGKVTYKQDFQNFIKEKGFQFTYKQRCSGNFFLKYFKFYLYEAVQA